MADIRRIAEATWSGNLREGNGTLSSGSGALDDEKYSFGTRFEDGAGTNPEELIAAAHAGCYSMALAGTLKRNGHRPEQIKTQAICTLVPQNGGFRISELRLRTRAQVVGMEPAAFGELAQQAEAECPVSNALRGGPTIQLDASLL